MFRTLKVIGLKQRTFVAKQGILFDWFRDREPRNIKTSSHILVYHMCYHMDTHLTSPSAFLLNSLLLLLDRYDLNQSF